MKFFCSQCGRKYDGAPAMVDEELGYFCRTCAKKHFTYEVEEKEKVVQDVERD